MWTKKIHFGKVIFAHKANGKHIPYLNHIQSAHDTFESIIFRVWILLFCLSMLSFGECKAHIATRNSFPNNMNIEWAIRLICYRFTLPKSALYAMTAIGKYCSLANEEWIWETVCHLNTWTHGAIESILLMHSQLASSKSSVDWVECRVFDVPH